MIWSVLIFFSHHLVNKAVFFLKFSSVCHVVLSGSLRCPHTNSHDSSHVTVLLVFLVFILTFWNSWCVDANALEESEFEVVRARSDHNLNTERLSHQLMLFSLCAKVNYWSCVFSLSDFFYSLIFDHVITVDECMQTYHLGYTTFKMELPIENYPLL